jgi:CRISPR type IV-associated protein Csf2
MNDHRIEGAAIALSSISHGGESAGTTQFFRREKIVQPDGTIAEIPVISGNSLRGILRDMSAELTWQMLGQPELSLQMFDVLWSGGQLAKAGSTSVLTATQLAELRRLVPHVNLFGASGGGRIIEGRLRVGKLIPICVETAHIVPSDIVPARPVTIWELLQLEEFSRRDDAKRPMLNERIAGVLTTGANSASTPEVSDIERDTAQQMRYGVETLAAGTRFHWWMALEGADDLCVAQLRAALNAWAAAGAHIGGRSSTGHGRLQLDCSQWVQTSSMVATHGSELAPEWHQQLRSHHGDHADRILDALSWLT